MYTFSRNEIQQKNKSQHKNLTKGKYSKEQIKKIAPGILGVTLLIISLFFWLNNSNKAYAVFINGEKVGIVQNRSEGERAIESYMQAKSTELGKSTEIKDEIEFKEVKSEEYNESEIIPEEKLADILGENINLLVPAVALVIDGEEKVSVSNKEIAESIIQKAKDQYVSDDKNIKIISVEVNEEIEMVEKNVPVKEIIDEEKALKVATIGVEKMVTHVVEKGESFWSIAHDNNMKVSELREANPQVKSDKIIIGDEMNLIKAEPMIHVAVTTEITKKERIPYKSKYVNDSTLWRGKDKVKQSGKSGSKEVTYRNVAINGQQTEKEVLNEKIISEPVERIVLRGTKVVTASRGSGGSGDLAWPLRGYITSRYGYRGREFHTGLDIDGVTGDPIIAAEDGTVIQVSWGGNYGKMIKIDHGDGLQTWYTHMSKYEVKLGEKVKRGELIGRVGNTGRSTGSHLHLEVRVNGSHRNPLKYLD